MTTQLGSIASSVRIVNESEDRIWTDKFGNQSITLAPGEDAIVPVDAVFLWLGDPSLQDIDARRRDRTDTYRHLRARYGVYENDQLWESRRPPIRAYTLGTGTEPPKQIITIADDPEGKLGAKVPDLGSSSDGYFMEQMAASREALDASNQTNQLLLSILTALAQKDETGEVQAILADINPQAAADIPVQQIVVHEQPVEPTTAESFVQPEQTITDTNLPPEEQPPAPLGDPPTVDPTPAEENLSPQEKAARTRAANAAKAKEAKAEKSDEKSGQPPTDSPAGVRIS